MMMMMMIISPFYGSPVSQRKMKVLCLSHSWWKCLGSASVPLLDWPFLLGRCRKEVSGWRTCWVSFILLHWKLEVSLGWFYSSSSARQNDPVHPELHISMSFLLSWSDVCVCVEHLSKFFLWFCKSFTGTVLEPDITVSSTEFTCISELNFSLSSPSVSTKASWSCSLFLFWYLRRDAASNKSYHWKSGVKITAVFLFVPSWVNGNKGILCTSIKSSLFSSGPFSTKIFP